MENLVEIIKIIEGALNSNNQKVRNYTEALIEKLTNNGEKHAAKKIKNILNQLDAKYVSLQKVHQVKGLPVDSESRLSLMDENFVLPGDSTIFLNNDTKVIVEEFINFVAHGEKLLKSGIGIAPSLLIYGPPGCGKTELARNISQKLSLPLLTARTDSIVSSYLGSTAKNIRLLFDHAMSRPCILFLDEFDAIAKIRDDNYELGELKRVVVSLLQNIDALDKDTILLAATNHEHLLDKAVWRRFAYKIKLPMPDSNLREKLFSYYLSKNATKDIIFTLSEISKNLSGADIKEVSENALRDMVVADDKSIDKGKIIKRLLPKIIPEVFSDITDEKELIVAVRNISPKVFNYRLMGEIFGKSTGTISNIINS